MRISDWSSDVCSSDLCPARRPRPRPRPGRGRPMLFGSRSAAASALPCSSLPSSCASGSDEIGRASCRERVCQYVLISVVAVSLKKKTYTVYNLTVSLNVHVEHMSKSTHDWINQ